MSSFVIKESGGNSNFENHPAGVVSARCTRIIDLGTQKDEYQGELKNLHKVVFFFETQTLMESGEFAGKPFLVNKEFTVSLGEKATLRKALESWRGRKFTPQELEGFDIKNVLGKPLMLNIVEYTKKNGASGTKIDSMMPLPNGMTANKAVGDLILFSFRADDGSIKPLDTENYEKISNFWQKKIATSPEFIQATQGSPKKASAPPAGDDMDDDVPF